MYGVSARGVHLPGGRLPSGAARISPRQRFISTALEAWFMSNPNDTTDARLVADQLLGRLIGGDPAAEADVLQAVARTPVVTASAVMSRSAQATAWLPSVGLLVAGAVLAGDAEPLVRAASLARSARERRLVVLARAHLDGSAELFDALVRDHLATYPDHLLAAWLAGRRRASATNPAGGLPAPITDQGAPR